MCSDVFLNSKDTKFVSSLLHANCYFQAESIAYIFFDHDCNEVLLRLWARVVLEGNDTDLTHSSHLMFLLSYTLSLH